MIEVEDLELRLGEEPLFRGISLRIVEGQRVCLAGRNGQGKSTLMKVLLGVAAYDGGKVSVAKGRTLGYLPQDLEAGRTGRTVIAEALTALPRLREAEAEAARLAEEVAATPHDEALLARYGRAQAAFEAQGGYGAEARARAILDGLGFSQARMGGPLDELSGGWLMRVHLAKLLIQAPDLLLLDEPTNHLDLESREWLLAFLRGFPGALLITSHDRYFLDQLVDRVLELEGGRLEAYAGNYSRFEVERQERLERLKAAKARQDRELKRQQEFIDKNRVRAATASNAQSRIKLIEKIERIELPPEPPRIKLRFPDPPSAGQWAFRCERLAKRYGSFQVFEGLDLEVPPGEKLAVVGRNGAGKTTLLKLLSGREQPSAGALAFGHNASLQYFSQYEDQLPGDGYTLIRAMEEAAPKECKVPRRTILGCFLFSDTDVEKRIGVLSGGERARLKLARMLLHPSNLLVLDEPTNHLDIHSKDVLLDALKAFAGTVVFVSHDRQFLSALATSVLEIKDGRATYYPCDYEQYRWRVDRDARAAAAAPPSVRGAAAPADEGASEPDKRARIAAREAERERKKLVSRLEKQVEDIQRAIEVREARVEELERAMALPGFFDDQARSVPATSEHKRLKAEVDQDYERFEGLLSALEEAQREA